MTSEIWLAIGFGLVSVALLIAVGMWKRRRARLLEDSWEEEDKLRHSRRKAEIADAWTRDLAEHAGWPPCEGGEISSDKILYRVCELSHGTFAVEYCRVDRTNWPIWRSVANGTEFANLKDAAKAAKADLRSRCWNLDEHTWRL